VREAQAFRLAASCWAIYALITVLPVLGYPLLMAPAIIRAFFGLVIAALFWFRPGRGIAIVGTILGFASIPLAFVVLANLSSLGFASLVTTAVALLTFATSASCWWLTARKLSRAQTDPLPHPLPPKHGNEITHG
jgi:hypothetical protein